MSDRTRVLAIDLDGVVRQWRGAGLDGAEKQFGLAPGTIAGRAFGTGAQELALNGVISHTEWCEDVRSGLAGKLGDAAADAVAYWQRDRGTADEDVVRELRDLHRDSVLALVTDSTDILPADLAVLGLTDLFDHVFASYAIGVTKPSPMVFRTVAERLGRAPSEITFIDDKPVNVKAAESIGMTGVLWEPGTSVRDVMDRTAAPDAARAGRR